MKTLSFFSLVSGMGLRFIIFFFAIRNFQQNEFCVSWRRSIWAQRYTNISFIKYYYVLNKINIHLLYRREHSRIHLNILADRLINILR